MCNSSQRRRSPDRMLHQTLSKGWCGHGSGLLLGLIVRARGGLVEARSRFAAAENRSPCPAQRSGGHHPGHSCPVASVSQREGLLALRLGASAPLLPEPLFAEPAQSAHPSPGARDARSAACLRPRARLSFGRLSRDGHDPRSGHREGEGFWQGALLWAGFLREERLQDRVGLRLQGCFGGRPGGDNHRFRSGPCGLRREAHREALVASERYGAYLADKGFTGLEWERHWMEQYGALVAATPKNDSRRAWPKADRRWASGKRQIIEGVISQLSRISSLWSVTVRRPSAGCWRVWRRRLQRTPAASALTTPSADRCAT